MVKFIFCLCICLFSIQTAFGFSLTEISFDGTAEWVEFYNSSSKTVSGNLVLSGVKNSLFTHDFSLGSGQYLLFTDKEQSVVSGCVQITDTGFSLADTKAIHISWYSSGTTYSGQILISEDHVQQVNNTGETFSINKGFRQPTQPTPCFTITEEEESQTHNESNEPELVDSSIVISEIYPFDNKFTEYIELYCKNEHCEGVFTLGGAGHGGANKEVQISLFSGQFIVISDNHDLIKNVGNGYYLPSLSLTDGGEKISLYGQSGHLIDSLVYSGGKSKDLSFYSDSTRFTPSPGFSQGIYNYFKQESQDEGAVCGFRIQNNTPFYSHHKINLIATHERKDIQNSSSKYHCERYGPEGAMLSDKCNPSYFPVFGSGIVALSVQINQSGKPLCTVTNSLNLPELPKTPETLNTVSGPKESSEATYIDIPGVDQPVTSPFIITKALPNPPGKDTGQEQLLIQNNSSQVLYITGLQLHNGSRNKSLPAISIDPFSQATIIGTLGLVNSAGCYYLHNTLYRTEEFCYVADGKEGWVDHISGLHAADTGFLASLKIKQSDEKVCIALGSEELLCKNKKYTDSEIKERKDTTKKHTSLLNKFETLSKRYNRLQKSNKELIQEHKKSTQELTNLYTITKNTLYIFQQTIRGNNQLLYEERGLSSLFSDWKYLTSQAKKGHSTFAYGGVTDTIKDIEYYNTLTQGTLPLHKAELQELLKEIYSTSTNIFDDYLP